MSRDNPEAFVYLWRDSAAGKFYLGYHRGTPDDNYAHSSTVMESFNMKSVPSGYRRKILARGSPEDMAELEYKLLTNRKERGRWDKYHNVKMSIFPYMWEDPDYIEKMKGMWDDPDYKEARSTFARQQWTDPEYRAMQSEKAKKQWEDKKFQAMQAAVSKQLWTDPEFVKRKSASAKKQWTDPEFHAMQVEKMRTQSNQMWEDPERRHQQSNRLKKLWTDPEFRTRQKNSQDQKLAVLKKTMAKRWADPEFRRKESARLAELNKQREVCYVCGHESSKPAITRWHNERCKQVVVDNGATP